MFQLGTIAFSLLLLCHSAVAGPSPQWSMGYYTPWGTTPLPISKIKWNALSHVIYGFAIVKADGSLDLHDQAFGQYAAEFVATAKANGVSPMFSLTQLWARGDTTSFQAAVLNHRQALVDNIVSVVNTYGFDGVDIDWEPFDTHTQGAALMTFASDLRLRLGTKLLTIAAYSYQADYSFWGRNHGVFNRVSVMTYDLASPWEPYTFFNSGLYDPDGRVWSVHLAVNRFAEAGVPLAKINIGIPFYGLEVTGATGPYQPNTGVSYRQTPYRDLAFKYNLQSASWDNLAQVPYLTGTYVTFDNERSVGEKVKYAKNRNLGGWIIWELAGDYIPTQTPTNPLSEAVQTAWSAGASANLPASTFLSPAGSTIPAGVRIQLAVSLSGPAKKVEFFVGTKRLCTKVKAPYTCNWKTPGKVGKNIVVTSKVYSGSAPPSTNAVTLITN